MEIAKGFDKISFPFLGEALRFSPFARPDRNSCLGGWQGVFVGKWVGQPFYILEDSRRLDLRAYYCGYISIPDVRETATVDIVLDNVKLLPPFSLMTKY